MKITIDKQFAALIPATSDAEDAEFERSVLQDGRILTPLIVWKHQNILLDGHRRSRLMAKHPTLKSPPPVVLDLESRQEAHDWIIHHQLTKRNVTPEQRRYLLGKLYLDHKPPRGRVKSVEASDLENAKKLAENEGVSEKTVRESANFAEAVDAVAEVSKEIKKAVLSGDVKATTKDLEAVADLPAKKAAAVAKKVESGEVKSVKEALEKVAPAEESKDHATDAVGNALPVKLRPAFTSAKEFDALNRDLQAISKRLEQLAELSPFLHLQSVQADISNAKRAVKFARPYAVCGYCKGKGCEACKRTGWVPKNIYESTPEQ